MLRSSNFTQTDTQTDRQTEPPQISTHAPRNLRGAKRKTKTEVLVCNSVKESRVRFQKYGSQFEPNWWGDSKSFFCKKLLPLSCCCCCESSREEVRGHQPDSPHSRIGDRQAPRAPRRNKKKNLKKQQETGTTRRVYHVLAVVGKSGIGGGYYRRVGDLSGEGAVRVPLPAGYIVFCRIGEVGYPEGTKPNI
jgi:hypothetical protein